MNEDYSSCVVYAELAVILELFSGKLHKLLRFLRIPLNGRSKFDCESKCPCSFKSLPFLIAMSLFLTQPESLREIFLGIPAYALLANRNKRKRIILL